MCNSKPFYLLPEEERAAMLARALEMRQGGAAWRPIGRALRMSPETLRAYLDPSYDADAIRKRRYMQKQERQHGRGRAPAVSRVRIERMQVSVKNDAAARIAEIPPDTRDVTARAFGDPIFERSVLGRERREAAE